MFPTIHASIAQGYTASAAQFLKALPGFLKTYEAPQTYSYKINAPEAGVYEEVVYQKSVDGNKCDHYCSSGYRDLRQSFSLTHQVRSIGSSLDVMNLFYSGISLQCVGVEKYEDLWPALAPVVAGLLLIDKWNALSRRYILGNQCYQFHDEDRSWELIEEGLLNDYERILVHQNFTHQKATRLQPLWYATEPVGPMEVGGFMNLGPKPRFDFGIFYYLHGSHEPETNETLEALFAPFFHAAAAILNGNNGWRALQEYKQGQTI